MYIGVDYYPEHWPRERWETDARLMKEAGFNVVRLAEFAWVDMEPREGQFDFAWLDDAIKLLARYGIDVILGTPTAVMPAWVAQKYPQALRTKADGTQIVWGGRKHNCFSNADYRRLSAADHAGHGRAFRPDAQRHRLADRQRVRRRGMSLPLVPGGFPDVAARQVRHAGDAQRGLGQSLLGPEVHRLDPDHDPRRQPRTGPGSWAIPARCLDWKRFITWQQVRFQADQVKILRADCPDDFVTHNFMGLFQGLDYYVMAEDLDFVAWDNYPIWSDKPDVPYSASLAADLMRGLKQKNFMIMEQTAGPCGWEAFGRNPWPGEIRKIAYQQLAHGSDGQIWFRWRTCTVGREQYWHGLLGHDGKPLRRYQEAAQTAKEFRQLGRTPPRHDGRLRTSRSSTITTTSGPSISSRALRATACRPRSAATTTPSSAPASTRTSSTASADLSKYKLVLAPDLSILPDETAAKLDAYVKNGGVLLADCRTGVKDERNLCHDRTLPGLLSPALGIRIEEYSPLPTDSPCTSHRPPTASPARTPRSSTRTGSLRKPPRSRPTYADQWHLKPFAAVTRNTYGKGKGWYVGTVIKETAFYDNLIGQLLKDADIHPLVTPPPGVEVSIREQPGKRLLFLINHTEEPKTVQVPKDKVELLTGQKTNESLALDRFGVAVIGL